MAASLVIAWPASADDAPAPAAPANVHASIDDAIAHQRGRQVLGVVGMAGGTIVILGGIVASALSHSFQHACNSAGDSCTRHDNAGYYVAGGVGLPLLGAGIYLFSDAQHNINQLKASPVALGYSPETHKPTLEVSFRF